MRKVLTWLTASSALLTSGLSTAWAGAIDLDQIDIRAQYIMDKPGMVGLAIAVVEDGEVVFTKGYGETLKGSGDPVTPETVFRWASVSKSVAAATVMELAEDGYFGVDNPAILHAPSLNLPRSKDPVTIEHILTHRVGIVRNEGDRKIEAGRFAKSLRGKLSQAQRVCKPGTCHTYQNVAYDATAEIAETATGLPYKSIVNERIFHPLGMTSASTTLAGLKRSKSWARPHNYSGHKYKEVLPTYYRIPGAAGVNSSVTDLAKWMTAQMDADNGAISPEVQTAMQIPRVKTPREERFFRRRFDAASQAFYGYGWRVYNYKGRRVVGHRGAVMGYRAAVLFDPEKNSGIAMLWNSGNGHPVSLQADVMDMIHSELKTDWAGLQETPDEPEGTGSP